MGCVQFSKFQSDPERESPRKASHKESSRRFTNKLQPSGDDNVESPRKDKTKMRKRKSKISSPNAASTSTRAKLTSSMSQSIGNIRSLNDLNDLTLRQRQVIQYSWELALRTKSGDLGVIARLTEQHADMEALFEDCNVQIMEKSFSAKLSAIVKCVHEGRIDEANGIIESLAAKHYGHGVRIHHISRFCRELLKCMEDALSSRKRVSQTEWDSKTRATLEAFFRCIEHQFEKNLKKGAVIFNPLEGPHKWTAAAVSTLTSSWKVADDPSVISTRFHDLLSASSQSYSKPKAKRFFTDLSTLIDDLSQLVRETPLTGSKRPSDQPLDVQEFCKKIVDGHAAVGIQRKEYVEYKTILAMVMKGLLRENAESERVWEVLWEVLLKMMGEAKQQERPSDPPQSPNAAATHTPAANTRDDQEEGPGLNVPLGEREYVYSSFAQPRPTPDASQSPGGKSSKHVRFTELANHNRREDCWILIECQKTGKKNVYDVTKFLSKHPGGASVILKNAGKDATREFARVHSKNAWNMLEAYHHGELASS